MAQSSEAVRMSMALVPLAAVKGPRAGARAASHASGKSECDSSRAEAAGMEPACLVDVNTSTEERVGARLCVTYTCMQYSEH